MSGGEPIINRLFPQPANSNRRTESGRSCGGLSQPIPQIAAKTPNLRSGRGPCRFREDAVTGDPVEGLGVGFLGVGLEDEALAGAPAAGVHLRVSMILRKPSCSAR